jgi:hypothetical protein
LAQLLEQQPTTAPACLVEPGLLPPQGILFVGGEPKLGKSLAVGDSYLLVTRPAPQLPTVELRFQFRYAAPQPPRLLELDPRSLWFSPAGSPPPTALVRRKVEPADVTEVLSDLGGQARYNQLRQGVMILTQCSKRTAQLAITEACQQGGIVPDNGHYRLPG